MSSVSDNGLDIQRRMATAEQYNKWIYDSIEPFLGQRILETGSAIGNMTRLFAVGRQHVTAVDLNPKYVEIAKQECSLLDTVDFRVCDVTTPELLAFRNCDFDTIIALNLLEHLESEQSALSNFHALLSDEGTLVTMVPAFNVIYGEMDKADNHFRRYTKKTIKKVFDDNGFDVVFLRYFNFIGFFAWFLNGKILKHSVAKQGNVSLYDFCVPFFRLFDAFQLPLGQSVICVGKKKNN